MLVKIENQPRAYAWGSRTLIADYFGPDAFGASGQPMAEVWFGTHEGSPARIADGSQTTLQSALGGHELSFLLKILAADAPLSIQAHPTTEQAEAGFARENAAGIPISASNRNYKDAHHKPEIIVALSEFEVLCGFRPIAEIEGILEDLESHIEVSETFRSMVADWRAMLATENGLQKVFSDVIHRRGSLDGFNAELAKMADFEARFAICERLNLLYPGDPGVIVALFMNHMILQPGQAVFLPAGNIHAYLGGLGVELMASSDNVLRGGLTPKHIDVDELEKVLDFHAAKVALVQPHELIAGLVEYPCDVEDFMLYRAEPSGDQILADLNLPGEAIILCTAGEVAVSNSLDERLVLKRGEAAYLSADAKLFTLSGAGTAYLATKPNR